MQGFLPLLTTALIGCHVPCILSASLERPITNDSGPSQLAQEVSRRRKGEAAFTKWLIQRDRQVTKQRRREKIVEAKKEKEEADRQAHIASRSRYTPLDYRLVANLHKDFGLVRSHHAYRIDNPSSTIHFNC